MTLSVIWAVLCLALVVSGTSRIIRGVGSLPAPSRNRRYRLR